MPDLLGFPFAALSLEALSAPLAGFIVVMTSLVLLWLLLELQGSLFRSSAARKAERERREAEQESDNQAVVVAAAALYVAKHGDGPSDEMVAVITAAAHAVVGSKIRVVSIKPGRSRHGSAWSAEGRKAIYSSHRIR